MRNRLCVIAIAIGVLSSVAACGGSSAPAREKQGKAQIDCLRSKQIEAVQNTDLAFDVSDKFFRYKASDPANSQAKVEVFVFDDHDKAIHNRVAITLQNEDNNRNQVFDNTLVSYSQVPGSAYSGAVSACVAPSSSESS